jgi:hypothetical protein
MRPLYSTEGWVCPTVDLDVLETDSFAPTGNRTPDCPARNPVTALNAYLPQFDIIFLISRLKN